jgi:DNA-binding NtrC family response regulator
LGIIPNGLWRFEDLACALLSPIAQHDGVKRGVGMIPRDRILLVDDNESVRRILAEGLEREGFRVCTAADGRRAWELVRRTPLSYDLVLTDVTMPEMDGIELLTRIMADSPWIKVILMTGRPDPNLKIKAEMLGAFTVLIKPLGLGQLQQTLKLALMENVREI